MASAEQVTTSDLINRELGWLEFNRRVLHEALDERNPLLERLKFLAIFSSNLDEFFMKRVGGLKRQIAAGVLSRTHDGMMPEEQLAAIRNHVVPLLADQARCFSEQLRPALAANNIHLVEWTDLSEAEKTFASEYFNKNVLPVLTPLAVDPGHPFPFLSNLSMSWGVALRYPDREEKLFARVKIPAVVPQWVRIDVERRPDLFRFVRLQDLVHENLEKLFPQMIILDSMLFRITRNADIERDEEDAEDLLEMVEDELRRRRFARIVRLEHGEQTEPWMLEFLVQELELRPEDVYVLQSELDYTSLRTIAELNLPHLKYEPWTPIVPPALQDEEANIFSVIRRGDILVHHPFENFAASVERFVRSAVNDKKVLAIKMTLYRTGDESPFIPLLIQAAEAGKQVVCLVELKAYFDEERNILWAQALEKAGVHVVYGIIGLKTHAKTILVVRQENEGIICYAHIGTGNYHPGTARLYTDLGLFTCNSDITSDISDLFHFLTGRSLKRDYRKLLVAPINMRERFLEMIEREIAFQASGRPSHIMAKMNSLEDPMISRALYRASQAGVKVDLCVRGYSALFAGVPGMSENIRVFSVIGRFLEHSRIFYFRNGAEDPVDGEFFLGSADWMYRNLNTRVEVVVPVEPRSIRERIYELFQLLLNDKRQSWEMQPEGRYEQRKPKSAEEEIGVHQRLIVLHRQRATGTN